MNFDSFESFIESVVIPKRNNNPNNLRLDGSSTGGNFEVAGVFRYQNKFWKVHSDTHYEPLLLAYNLIQNGETEAPFLIKNTSSQKSACLVLNPVYQQRLSKPKRKYLYIYQTDSLKRNSVTNFFQYWKPEQVKKDIESGEKLAHIGSDQFKKQKVKPNDIIWVSTVKNSGELFLVGRLEVGEVTSYEKTVQQYNAGVFDRKHHVIAKPNTEEPYNEVSLMNIASQLRFISKDNDRLAIKENRVDAKQLQTIRKLTSESVELLENKWNKKLFPNTDDYERNEFLQESEEEQKILQSSLLVTEKEQLVLARRGQGKFRSNLELVENGCRLTGVTDKRFLIASHIKSWKDSSNEEKLDGNNGLLLSPHVDKLFDRGWISFSDEGEILCQNEEIKGLMKVWSLDFNKSVGSFNDKQKLYLAYHREKFDFD